MELIDGKVCVVPPPGHRHGWIEKHVAALLTRLLEDPGHAAVVTNAGFVLRRDPDHVRSPDVSMVTGVSPAALPAGYLEDAPQSPSRSFPPGIPLRASARPGKG